ncbi:MAG: hypothetical protein Q7U60_05155 [Candidatus Methanoperedens sp.]|nr:hypothetical protein [Candidatus Methanoperedens sp.]
MNKWKALALVMITLLIIAVGIRFVYVESHTFPLNEEQKSSAINTAKDALKNEVEGNNYNITVQEHGRIIPAANGDKKVVRVVFTNGNITLTALVDMDTGNVVEKNKMEYSGWMAEYQSQKPQRWAHKRLFRAT